MALLRATSSLTRVVAVTATIPPALAACGGCREPAHHLYSSFPHATLHAKAWERKSGSPLSLYLFCMQIGPTNQRHSWKILKADERQRLSYFCFSCLCGTNATQSHRGLRPRPGTGGVAEGVNGEEKAWHQKPGIARRPLKGKKSTPLESSPNSSNAGEPLKTAFLRTDVCKGEDSWWQWRKNPPAPVSSEWVNPPQPPGLEPLKLWWAKASWERGAGKSETQGGRGCEGAGQNLESKPTVYFIYL